MSLRHKQLKNCICQVTISPKLEIDIQYILIFRQLLAVCGLHHQVQGVQLGVGGGDVLAPQQ